MHSLDLSARALSRRFPRHCMRPSSHMVLTRVYHDFSTNFGLVHMSYMCGWHHHELKPLTTGTWSLRIHELQLVALVQQDHISQQAVGYVAKVDSVIHLHTWYLTYVQQNPIYHRKQNSRVTPCTLHWVLFLPFLDPPLLLGSGSASDAVGY